MGKSFGNLYYIRNIVYTKVSGYEQRAFGNFWRDSIRNLATEFRLHAPVALPPLAIAYLAIQWGQAERERMVRKDPSLYKDDE